MTSTSAMPADMLARIFIDNDATGAPVRVALDGSTDGSVTLFTANKAMNSNVGQNFTSSGALDTNCFTRTATETASGPTAVLADCPVVGSMEFLGNKLKGYKPVYKADGSFDSLGISAPGTTDCDRGWGSSTAGAASSFTIIELIGYRNCDDTRESVRANIFRNVTDITPAGNFQFALEDPGSQTTDLNLNKLEAAGAGWAASPLGLLFPLFDDTAGAVPTTDPVTIGTPVGTAALYQLLADLCSCKNTVRGIPLDAATILATPELVGNGLISD